MTGESPLSSITIAWTVSVCALLLPFSSPQAGEEGVGITVSASPDPVAPDADATSRRIQAQAHFAAGATLEAFDNDDLFSQIVDWSRCMQVGLSSQAVADVIQENYAAAAEARFEGMSKALEEKIGDAEAAVVIISSARSIKMPEGAEQFNVMPPELDELVRWTREASEQAMAEAQRAQEAVAAGEDPHAGHDHSQDQPENGGSGLWTPGSA